LNDIIKFLKGEVSNGKSQYEKAINVQEVRSFLESQSQRRESMSEMPYSILGHTFYQTKAKKKGGEK